MPITAQINVTPDGFCNHDDVAIDDDFMRFAVETIKDADCLVLGRKTYELFVAHWPQAARDSSLPPWEQKLGQAIDEIERIVISTTLAQTDWPGTAIWPTIDSKQATDLRAARRCLVLGSPSIIDQLVQWSALDTLLLSVHPVLGGAGKRLYGGIPVVPLTFVQEYETGSSVRTYEFAQPAQ